MSLHKHGFWSGCILAGLTTVLSAQAPAAPTPAPQNPTFRVQVDLVTTDVLVRGKPNAQQIAGKDAGSKLIEVRRLAARGHKVTIINERQFWRLAQPTSRGTKKASR